jgi:chaperonin GroES
MAELEPRTPLKVEEIVSVPNIATLLDQKYLDDLGKQIVQDYKDDEQSRSGWLDNYEAAMKIATQVYEKKSTPWENASNVRFPLITIGAMQFHARAYPALLPSKGVVQIGTVGIDVDGRKGLVSKLIAAHMNYQFEYEMKEWEEDMDRLLITLPVTGCEFKKTYYDPQKGYNCSEYVRSTDLVVNYYAKSLEEAARKIHVLSMNENEIVEMQRAGLFLDVQLGEPIPRDDKVTKVIDTSIGVTAPGRQDSATPRKTLEWHGFVDLDDDDYKEPYVITVDEKTGKVLRIVARFFPQDIKRNSDNAISKITPTEYFTKFDFIPNPTGGIYGIGFGVLLGPLNESANTLINQLVDAGTLSNRQSGFISRNLRIKNGAVKFSPGEWKEVNATGADLSQGIMPLPVREPSMVLFQLLNTLITAGERLTSTTDMMVGENPGQNQKATTTMAVLDQGQKVFTAIYKRIRRAMTKEFQKVFALNAYYLDENKTKILFDGEATMKKEMYNKDNMVVFPSADPNVSSSAEKAQTAQVLMQMIPMGGFNEYEIKRRALDALGITDPEALLLDPNTPPPPDPKMVEVQQDGMEQDFRRKLDVAKFTVEAKQDEKDLEIKEVDAATRRLVAMTQGFIGGAEVSNKSRELIQKERDSRRKHAAKSGEK